MVKIFDKTIFLLYGLLHSAFGLNPHLKCFKGKGNNFAKKVLSPELAKKVSKTNALGFSTYVGLAALSSLGIYLGTKVKDAIAKPKLVEKKQA